MYIKHILVLHGNIDQALVNSLHGLLTFDIGVLNGHVITTRYTPHVCCIVWYLTL